MKFQTLGFVLCVLTMATCALLHLATFIAPISSLFLLVVVPFALLCGALLCARTLKPRQTREVAIWQRGKVFVTTPAGNAAIVGWILLVYSLALFYYQYKTTGGASSVGVVDGRYVYLDRSNVIRSITESEYKMFPARVARVMSAWIAMMASFCMSSFPKDRSEVE
jgi:hypothetical protein